MKPRIVGAALDTFKFRNRYDYFEDYLRRHAPGRTVIDVGSMWLVHGRFAFFAEQAGAREVVSFDILDRSPEFQREHERRKSSVRYVQGDLMDPGAIANLGSFDLVFCSGVLYHLPDPLTGLRHLKSLAADRLLLGTAVVTGHARKQHAIYYPYLKKPWTQRVGEAIGVPGRFFTDYPYRFDPAEQYANWYWGFSPRCFGAMAASVGLEVERVHDRWHFACFECRRHQD